MTENREVEKHKKLVLIGGGGHCRSVLDAAMRTNVFEEIVITDRGMPAGTKVMGCRVAGSDEMLPELLENGFRWAFISIGSIKSTKRRETAYRLAESLGFQFPTITDPSAIVSEEAELGSGIFVGKGAVINAGAHIGDMAIINSGAVVEHECRIGKFSHIAVGAVVCGRCDIGDSVFVGANATVIQEVRVGMNSVIGAGSVVLREVASGSRIVGQGGVRRRNVIALHTDRGDDGSDMKSGESRNRRRRAC